MSPCLLCLLYLCLASHDCVFHPKCLQEFQSCQMINFLMVNFSKVVPLLALVDQVCCPCSPPNLNVIYREYCVSMCCLSVWQLSLQSSSICQSSPCVQCCHQPSLASWSQTAGGSVNAKIEWMVHTQLLAYQRVEVAIYYSLFLWSVESDIADAVGIS